MEAWFDAVALADRDFEGGILHTINVFHKLWVKEVEIEKSMFNWNVWMLRAVGYAG